MHQTDSNEICFLLLVSYFLLNPAEHPTDPDSRPDSEPKSSPPEIVEEISEDYFL